MRKDYMKQVLILDDKLHQSYLESFKEEPLSFWDFVNFMLGSLYDEDHIVDDIIPNIDASKVIIIYQMKMFNKLKT